MDQKILIVEDDPTFRNLLYEILFKDYTAVATPTAEEALSHLRETSFDLILIDVGLPGMDGFKFGQAVRKMAPSLPIVFLSGQSTVEDRVNGFSVGAVDYISKPVDRRELLARIKARLSSTTGEQDVPESLGTGPITIHLPTQRASYSWQGRRYELDLTATEFRLLAYFLAHPNQVLTRTQLMQKVWTKNRLVNRRNVDVTVSKLRIKLGPYEQLLRTVRGQGYRLLSRGNR